MKIQQWQEHSSQSWVFDFAKTFFYRNSTVSTAGNSLLPLLSSGQTFSHAMQKTAMQFPLLWVKIKDKDILLMLSSQQNTFAPGIGNQSLFFPARGCCGYMVPAQASSSFMSSSSSSSFFLAAKSQKGTNEWESWQNPVASVPLTNQGMKHPRPAVGKKYTKPFWTEVKGALLKEPAGAEPPDSPTLSGKSQQLPQEEGRGHEKLKSDIFPSFLRPFQRDAASDRNSSDVFSINLFPIKNKLLVPSLSTANVKNEVFGSGTECGEPWEHPTPLLLCSLGGCG